MSVAVLRCEMSETEMTEFGKELERKRIKCEFSTSEGSLLKKRGKEILELILAAVEKDAALQEKDYVKKCLSA